ncbi:hypothetical protein GCM10010286_40450 [Streptomyces toxytricini]|nr:hypothetical protein GCM10010286_40450 [Streptomyces toxytricini]
MDGGALDRGQAGLLVAAVGGVLVLLGLGPGVAGVAEHLDDCGVSRRGLQPGQAAGPRGRRCRRALGKAAAGVRPGAVGVVVFVHGGLPEMRR